MNEQDQGRKYARDWMFKRTLQDLDELLNICGGVEKADILEARRSLLSGETRALVADFAEGCFREDTKTVPVTSGTEGLLPSSQRGEGSGPLRGENISVVQTKEKTLFISPPMDFRGTWKTENGSIVNVRYSDYGDAWAVYEDGKIKATYDDEGNTNVPGYNLVERVRAGAKYRSLF